MKRKLWVKRFLATVLAATMVVTNGISVFAAERTSPKTASVNSISDTTLKNTIEDIITWAKHGNEKLINPEFLTMVGTTPGDWFPIGIGRYGYADDYDAYIKAITANVTERYKSKNKLHAAKATEWHRISLAVLAMGGDPTNIGQDPDGSPINLIKDGTYDRVDRNGRPILGKQGINGLIWGLISVDAKNYEIPDGSAYTRDDIISQILSKQCPDGGFALYGAVSDPDISAMAVQSLAPYYYDNDKTYAAYNGENKTVKQVVDETLAVLSKQQSEDGDFFSWGTQNVESTDQVVVALCSLGIDPEKDERFIKNGHTLIDGIMKYRNPADGGFFHSYTYDPENPSALPDKSNSMATEQTLYTLVSYWRLRNNMRNLYDYRAETDQSKFNIMSNEKEYTISFDRNTHDYTISLPYATSSIKFTNIPKGPYDKCNIEENKEITVNDNSVINFTFTSRTGETSNYNIKVELSNSAEVESLTKTIDSIPENPTLKDKALIYEAFARYTKLSVSDKEKLSNKDKLISAKAVVDKLQVEEDTKRDEILKKIEELPDSISIADKKMLSDLYAELKELEDFDGKDAALSKLQERLNKIEELEKAEIDSDKKDETNDKNPESSIESGKVPNTGDKADIIFYAVLLMASAFVICSLKKKERFNR
ncbi:MAG: hypothetical protein MR639_07520 [Clostridium sp.]|uniref:hypothetical protein n=1 Tax=Clostridium sp. TaxID=1506 RepID=UPI002A88D26F|nr:hypothetical protein [Clostridium sp.]MDY5097385.1 hypothetical protein [Clostridium sp.]